MSSGGSVLGDDGEPLALSGDAARAESAPASNRRLQVLLAAAMFVLVVDTSLMNVSISKVVEDLGTTVSGVQGAIALEALVSAAFILDRQQGRRPHGPQARLRAGSARVRGGRPGDGVLPGLTAIIVFWAIIGGLGASLLLPAMQSLIHGNFEGAAQKQAYALVGARRRSPPPSGRCSAASSRRSCRGASGSCSRSS
jgi:hypothetical protein